MRFGLLVGTNSAPPVFNPATLNLSIWVRGSYVPHTWTGNASAGNSGSHNLTEGGAAIGTGTAVNGYDPASFGGVGSQKYFDSVANNVAWGSGAGSILVMCKPASAPADDPNTVNIPGIIGVAGTGKFQMGFSTAGLRVSAYDGSYHELSIAASSSAWHTFAAIYDGTHVRASVDGSALASASANSSAPTLSSATVEVGANNAVFGGEWDGLMMEVMLSTVAFSDSDIANVITYLKNRYPAAGLP